MKKFLIQIDRKHKSGINGRTPVNYIPEIECENEDMVIDLPEVQKAVNEAYGKNIIVEVHPFHDTYFLQYEVLKPTAFLR